jgi:RNA polymerase sigma factor (sigma-70 family)
MAAPLDEVIATERKRLGNFIRKQVADRQDAEDILQDVFYELVVAYQLMKPIENAGAWLFRVARNRIIDLFRKKQPEPAEDLALEDWLPSADEGPDAAYARAVLLEEIEDALAELPDEQREVFLAHEVEGISFNELSARTGVNVNTLLSRKRYAVLHLRQRLRSIYNEGDL